MYWYYVSVIIISYQISCCIQVTKLQDCLEYLKITLDCW